MEYPLSDYNCCLRGCSLKNYEFVYGVVVYTGHETKTMLNSIKSRPKKSTLERIMSKQIVFVFLVQVTRINSAPVVIIFLQTRLSAVFLPLSGQRLGTKLRKTS